MRNLSVLICAAALFACPVYAQIPIPNSAPPPPGQDPNAGKQGSSIKVDVNLVVLHTTVIDARQPSADGSNPENFPVFDNKSGQKVPFSTPQNSPSPPLPLI